MHHTKPFVMSVAAGSSGVQPNSSSSLPPVDDEDVNHAETVPLVVSECSLHSEYSAIGARYTSQDDGGGISVPKRLSVSS